MRTRKTLCCLAFTLTVGACMTTEDDPEWDIDEDEFFADSDDQDVLEPWRAHGEFDDDFDDDGFDDEVTRSGLIESSSRNAESLAESLPPSDEELAAPAPPSTRSEMDARPMSSNETNLHRATHITALRPTSPVEPTFGNSLRAKVDDQVRRPRPTLRPPAER